MSFCFDVVGLSNYNSDGNGREIATVFRLCRLFIRYLRLVFRPTQSTWILKHFRISHETESFFIVFRQSTHLHRSHLLQRKFVIQLQTCVIRLRCNYFSYFVDCKTMINSPSLLAHRRANSQLLHGTHTHTTANTLPPTQNTQHVYRRNKVE